MNSESVLASLTEDEKIKLLSGVGNWHTYDCNGKIPVVMMCDGPHGLRKQEEEGAGDINLSKKATCFPTASAIACSWDKNMVSKMAESIASEAKNEHVSIVLGCGINIKRSPLCGRNFEYFSEDPYLTGTLAVAYINSMQSKGIGTSLKHFAGNSQETRRQTSNSQIDERALREIYLTAFEMAVKHAQPTTVMASYNRLNGKYACANSELLTGILRNEWGFNGAVVTDWGAMVNAAECISAGTDLEMPESYGYHSRKLKEALRTGELTEKELNRACTKVLDHIVSLYRKEEDNEVTDWDKQSQIARELEDASAVLLKNEGILPISTSQSIVVVGDLAKRMRYQGAGSSHINTGEVVDAVTALKNRGYEVDFRKGYRNEESESDEKLEHEAVDSLNEDSVVLFFCGLTDRFEGEGYDRTDIQIPKCQLNLLTRICNITKKVVAVTFGGAPIDMSFVNQVQAILHMYLGGQSVGEACADLISGDVNPSGKLAETFPLSIDDVPASRYYAPQHDDVEYRESIFVGYRYYETYKVPVRFEFGYGLSYTTFKYENIGMNRTEYDNGLLTINYDITNTGKQKGSEISQVYVVNPQGKLMRPNKELRGYCKTELLPGETKHIEVTLDERAFSIYDIKTKQFEVIQGDYQVAVGASVKDIRLQCDIRVIGKKYANDDSEDFPDYYKENKHGMCVSEETFSKLYGKPLSRLRDIKRGEFTLGQSFQDVCKQSVPGKIMIFIADRIVASMCKGRPKDDPASKMVIMGVKEGSLESLIANSNGMISSNIVEMLVLFANKQRWKAIKKLFGK